MVRPMQAPLVEWIKHPLNPSNSTMEGWRLAMLAIDGRVASFEVRIEDLRAHETDEACEAMVIRQAKSYLDEFGDFKNQRENQYV